MSSTSTVTGLGAELMGRLLWRSIAGAGAGATVATDGAGGRSGKGRERPPWLCPLRIRVVTSSAFDKGRSAPSGPPVVGHAAREERREPRDAMDRTAPTEAGAR